MSVTHLLSRAIIIHQDQLLLCKVKNLDPPFFFLPGGHVEHGEGLKEALLRELAEEIALPFTIQRFVGCIEYSFKPPKHQTSVCHTHEVNFIFEAHSPKLTLDLVQIEDHIELKWVPLKDIETVDIKPEPLKKVITDWRYSEKQEIFHSHMIELM